MSSLNPVGSLIGKQFQVKAYQRGYRWKEHDVIRLLDDIREFGAKRNFDELYCLQPVVVKRDEDESVCELIDGQQRLTTIMLILNCLAAINPGCSPAPYAIEYETRQGTSGSFLRADFYKQSVDKLWGDFIAGDRAADKIDNYHFYHAAAAVHRWSSNNLPPAQMPAFQHLILSAVAVIWYEPPGDESSEEIFSRLNVGKIPLTNAELLKAAFLHQRPARAYKWNEMEQALETDDFWYFLNKNAAKTSSPMDFLFDLAAGRTDREQDVFFSFSRLTAGNAHAGRWPATSDNPFPAAQLQPRAPKDGR